MEFDNHLSFRCLEVDDATALWVPIKIFLLMEETVVIRGWLYNLGFGKIHFLQRATGRGQYRGSGKRGFRSLFAAKGCGWKHREVTGTVEG